MVNEYCYDIPLLESLQNLLKCDSVVEQVNLNFILTRAHQCSHALEIMCNTIPQIFNPHQMSDGILADYCDGLQCRQHPLFGKDRHALQIFLYYDDAEVVNPLGSSATIHKLGMCTMSYNIRHITQKLKVVLLNSLPHTLIEDTSRYNWVFVP